MRLPDEQWEVLEPYIPDPLRRADGRGRPWRDKRAGLEGILWVLALRGALGGPTQGIPTIPDLPSALPTVGGSRRVCPISCHLSESFAVLCQKVCRRRRRLTKRIFVHHTQIVRCSRASYALLGAANLLAQ